MRAPHLAPPRRLRTAAVLVLIAGVLSGCTATQQSTAVSTDKPLISAKRCAENRAAGTITYLTSYLYTASSGILDVVAAKQRGYFADMCLDVKIQPGSTNAQLVGSGAAQFAGLGGASDVITARDKGAKVTGIATFGNTAAITLLSNADSDIRSLKDFEGRTIGYKGVVPPQIEAMFVKAHVPLSSIKFVSVPQDPSILPQHKVDGLTGYLSNEPHLLAEAGHKVKEWNLADYGIKSTFNADIVNTAFAKAHPTAVQDFLRADLHAFDWIEQSNSDLTTALSYSAKLTGPAWNQADERYRWTTESALITKSQPAGTATGWLSAAQWQPEADALTQFKVVSSPPDLAAEIDASYYDAIHQGTKLIWPGP